MGASDGRAERLRPNLHDHSAQVPGREEADHLAERIKLPTFRSEFGR